MSKHSKRYREDLAQIDPEKTYPLPEAVDKVKSFHKTKFDQSIEFTLLLGIDPKQADQLIRGSISLPHSVGGSKQVIAFVPDDKVAACKEAGAIEAGGEELVKKIEGGWMDFEVAVATPEMMRVIAKLGRVLGPRGLMPSPKAGTVTQDIETAVREYVAGKQEFRNDAGGNVRAVVGKQSLPAEQVVENAEHFLDAIRRMKPSSSKGHYLRKASMAATMTPGVQVEV